MADGEGCKCSAWCENECCCDGVDWRSSREVELEEKVKALEMASEILREKNARYLNLFKEIHRMGCNNDASFEKRVAYMTDWSRA